MTTLDNIPTITRIEVSLRRGEFEERQIYGLPSFDRFMRETLPELKTGILEARQSPEDQMHNILRKWIAGKPMTRGKMFSNLKPTKHGVWELKTADLRIFGWLYRPKVFIAAFAGFTDDYKDQNGVPPKESYDDARDRVAWIRNSLPLDPPPFVTGDFNALV